MNRELIVVQRLVDALDDSRSLYDKGADKVAHPHLRDLLERIAGTHRLIADDLAGQIVEAGGGVARHGSRFGPLRTFLAEKSAQISFDIEMVYASHAVKRETGILRGFRAAIASIRDAGLCNRLRMHCRELERASMEISCLRTAMQLRTNPRTTRAPVAVHVPARAADRGANQSPIQSVSPGKCADAIPGACTRNLAPATRITANPGNMRAA